MPHLYPENHLVEQSAIARFAVLGWQTVRASDETCGAILAIMTMTVYLHQRMG